MAKMRCGALGNKLLMPAVLLMVVMFTLPVYGALPDGEQAVHAYNRHNLYYEDEFNLRVHGQNQPRD